MLRLPLLPAFIASIGLLLSHSAAATGFHYDDGFDWGISLQDLVDGETFESENGQLAFSGFDADTSGIAIDDLDLYRVIPTDDGFKIFAPLLSWFGKDAQLDLTYDVDAADGKQVAGMSVSFFGAAFGPNASAGVMATVLSGEDELATLMAGTDGGFDKGHGPPPWAGWGWGHGRGWSHGRGHHHRGKLDGGDDGNTDSVMFKDGYDSISVLEKIFASTSGAKDGKCWWHSFDFAKAIVVDHSFKTVMVPEPGTWLLFGVAGLAFTLRRRA
jgi:hypothetical protein